MLCRTFQFPSGLQPSTPACSTNDDIIIVTDPSKSKLGKKTERRVTFAVRVCTATVETGFAENLYNAIIFVQDFSPVSTTSGV
jgi:hypothetical protein